MKSMNKGMVWHYILQNLATGNFFYGQTKDTRKDDRHKDGDYTKLFSDWDLLGQEHHTTWFEIPKEGTHLDKLLHPKIDLLPIVKYNSNRGSKECFALINGVKDRDILLKEIEDLVWKQFKGKKERIQLNLRYPQRIFRDKVNRAFSQGFKSMLLCALMRTGKVVMCSQAIVDNNFEVSLVLSRVKSPEQSWKEDIEQFDAFENIEYIRIKTGKLNTWKDKYYEALNNGKQVVLFSTPQNLMSRLALFHDIKLDCLILDEVHVGGKAEQLTTIRKYFDTAFVIDVSGTAFDYIEQYTDLNRFVWTYFNNVKYCLENNLPFSKINISVAKYDNEFKKYHPDAPDSITNLFGLNDAEDDFRYPALVMAFINEHLVLGKNPKVLPSQETLVNSKHIYCAMPSIAACNLMCEYIKKSDCIYNPLSCHGESGVGYREINAHLERYSHTICFTVCANVLGVTAPWDTIMMLSTGESIPKYLQMIFRACSNHNQDALVIDWAAERSLKMFRDYDLLTNSSSNIGSQLLSGVSYLDCINTIGYNTGFDSLDITEIDKVMALDVKDLSKVCADSSMINTVQLLEFDFSDIAYLRDGHRSYQHYVVNDNDTNQSKAKKVKKTQQQKEFENLAKKKNETVLVYSKRFAKVVFMEQFSGNRVENVQQLLASDHFQDTVGIHPNVFADMIEEGCIHENIINANISDVNICVAKNIETNIIETLASVSTFDGVNRPIPEECFDGMMEGTSVK
jgi:hypothetical protein